MLTRPGIVAVADVHVGNHGRFGGELREGLNRRCWAVLAALDYAVRVANEAGATLFIAGDLFDRHDPPARMVAGVMQALSAADHVVVVCGNHDRADGDHHALGPLSWLPNAQVVTRPQVLYCGGWEVLCVPFQRGRGQDWLLPELARWGATPALHRRALVTHLGLRTPATPWFLRDSADAIDAPLLAEHLRAAGAELALLGNWHAPLDVRDGGVEIRQCGALVPTGWDDPGLDYGRVVGPDGWLGAPAPGPRFLDWGRHELSLAPGAGQYVRARVSAAQEAGVASELEALRATGAVAAFEVLVERAGAVAVAPTPGVSRAAALRARVDATEVREPGSREAVHEWLARELRIT